MAELAIYLRTCEYVKPQTILENFEKLSIIICIKQILLTEIFHDK